MLPPLPKWASAASGETGCSTPPPPLHAPPLFSSTNSAHLCRAACAPPSTWSRSGKCRDIVILGRLEVDLVEGGEGGTKLAPKDNPQPSVSAWRESFQKLYAHQLNKETRPESDRWEWRIPYHSTPSHQSHSRVAYLRAAMHSPAVQRKARHSKRQTKPRSVRTHLKSWPSYNPYAVSN